MIKKITLQVLSYLIAGGIVFVSVLLALSYYNNYNKYSLDPNNKVMKPDDVFERHIYDWELLKKEVVILKHEQIEDPDYFSVHGMLENRSAKYTWNFFVRVKIMIGESRVGGCRSFISNLHPGEKLPFLVTCYDTDGRNLPESISYEVGIIDPEWVNK